MGNESLFVMIIALLGLIILVSIVKMVLVYKNFVKLLKINGHKTSDDKLEVIELMESNNFRIENLN